MTFTVGGVDVAAVHVGATAADAVYLGANKVWPTGPPQPWPTWVVIDDQVAPGKANQYASTLSISPTDADGRDWSHVVGMYPAQVPVLVDGKAWNPITLTRALDLHTGWIRLWGGGDTFYPAISTGAIIALGLPS